MTEDVTKLNIYQKMDLVRVLIKNVSKNINLQYGNGGYKAVAEADVVRAVNEAEHQARLVSYQDSIEIINNEHNRLFWIRVKCNVKVVNIDNPSEFVVFTGLGDGLDSGDKACGKAITYATKYALLRGYKIPTGEDPDYFASPEPTATEEQINEYIELIGGEDKVPIVCKKLGVNSLTDLPYATLEGRIINLRERNKK